MASPLTCPLAWNTSGRSPSRHDLQIVIVDGISTMKELINIYKMETTNVRSIVAPDYVRDIDCMSQIYIGPCRWNKKAVIALVIRVMV